MDVLLLVYTLDSSLLNRVLHVQELLLLDGLITLHLLFVVIVILSPLLLVLFSSYSFYLHTQLDFGPPVLLAYVFQH